MKKKSDMLVCFFVVIVPLENYDDVKMVRSAIYTCSALMATEQRGYKSVSHPLRRAKGCIYIVSQFFFHFSNANIVINLKIPNIIYPDRNLALTTRRIITLISEC